MTQEENFRDAIIRKKALIERLRRSLHSADIIRRIEAEYAVKELEKQLFLLVRKNVSISRIRAEIEKQTEPKKEQERFSASADYRTVRFNGQQHRLTRNQATMIQLLHKAHQGGTRALGKATLLKAIEAETSRVRSSWKDSPLWGTLIVSNRSPRGTYQLNLK
jgi:hypothetical protein